MNCIFLCKYFENNLKIYLILPFSFLCIFFIFLHYESVLHWKTCQLEIFRFQQFISKIKNGQKEIKWSNG